MITKEEAVAQVLDWLEQDCTDTKTYEDLMDIYAGRLMAAVNNADKPFERDIGIERYLKLARCEMYKEWISACLKMPIS